MTEPTKPVDVDALERIYTRARGELGIDDRNPESIRLFRVRDDAAIASGKDHAMMYLLCQLWNAAPALIAAYRQNATLAEQCAGAAAIFDAMLNVFYRNGITRAQFHQEVRKILLRAQPGMATVEVAGRCVRQQLREMAEQLRLAKADAEAMRTAGRSALNLCEFALSAEGAPYPESVLGEIRELGKAFAEPRPGTSLAAENQRLKDHVAGLAEMACDAVEPALTEYRCHRTIIEDDGGGLPLVDKLCAPGASDVSTGKDELALLADAIGGAILDAIPGSAATIEANAKLRQLLRECQYSGPEVIQFRDIDCCPTHERACPICGRTAVTGHASDCRLAAALAPSPAPVGQDGTEVQS